MAAKSNEVHKLLQGVGRRLLNYRLHMAETQEEMGKRYGVSKGAWSQFEAGKRKFNLEVALLFSITERLSLDAIYLGECETEKERLMIRHPRQTWAPEELDSAQMPDRLVRKKRTKSVKTRI